MFAKLNPRLALSHRRLSCGLLLEAAEAGVLCLLGQPGPANMTLDGFTVSAMGNNPLAFGFPVPGQPPLVCDMSCSVAARGKIQNAAREGHDLPAGWALNGSGRPTDP